MFSCRKDEPKVDSTGVVCPEYEPTDDSFNQLIITENSSEELYQKTYDESEEYQGIGVDINCDGFDDFIINSTTDADWYDGFTIKKAELTFACLNPKMSVLTTVYNDTVYENYNDDTVGVTIYHNNITSSYPINGGSIQSVTPNSYVKGVAVGDTISGNDPGWTSSSIRMLYHYENGKTWYLGTDTNGYYHEAPQSQSTDVGLLNNNANHIALKFDGDKGVKLGYLKLDAWVSGSFTHVAFKHLRMHR
jgi:hypothetical protein